jgi:hypothetical protein
MPPFSWTTLAGPCFLAAQDLISFCRRRAFESSANRPQNSCDLNLLDGCHCRCFLHAQIQNGIVVLLSGFSSGLDRFTPLMCVATKTYPDKDTDLRSSPRGGMLLVALSRFACCITGQFADTVLDTTMPGHHQA